MNKFFDEELAQSKKQESISLGNELKDTFG